MEDNLETKSWAVEKGPIAWQAREELYEEAKFFTRLSMSKDG